jgi:hypothetical protein
VVVQQSWPSTRGFISFCFWGIAHPRVNSATRNSISARLCRYSKRPLTMWILPPGLRLRVISSDALLTVHGGVIPGTRSKARKPLWRRDPPVGPLKQSHATFNSWSFEDTAANTSSNRGVVFNDGFYCSSQKLCRETSARLR